MASKKRPPAKESADPPDEPRAAAESDSSTDSGAERAEESGSDGQGAPLAPGACPVIVGIGSSAGGLEALNLFFAHVPQDSGLAFVVITHHAPGHATLLPALLQKRTPLRVVEVLETTTVEPNTVYVAAPGKTLFTLNGRLHPLDESASVPPLPIDFFFRSLAQDQRERAIAVVLSGTGNDGTAGCREIKANLGMCMAQDESTARHPGMPHSAIMGDSPDFVLAPQAMPRQLIAYLRATQRLEGRASGAAEQHGTEEAMQQIFMLLRGRTGHDFSAYKETTVRRRIERRMVVHRCDTVRDYVQHLRTDPVELDALFDELLIGVTSFFRDPEAFESLRPLIMEMLESKPEETTVRVWVAGCSTGEEAYSLAILFRECAEELRTSRAVQIFATDLDPKAIDVARAGVYSSAIAADVSPERLKRYFVSDGGHCRVRKEIREMLVFATQNLVEDPPFTKLDMLCCRNLLIYLDGKLQKRLLPIFHYSLRQGGLVFLGSSETIGSFGNLFDTVDKQWRIFRRKAVPSGAYVADIPASVSQEVTVADAPYVSMLPRRLDVNIQIAEKVLLRELVPPTAIIREGGDIVHIHGRTGLFLEPAPGSQHVVNIFNMAREGLQLELTAAVRQAARQDREVTRRGVRVRTNGHVVPVDLRVRRIQEPESCRGLFTVTFELVREKHDADLSGAQSDSLEPPRIAELERELQYTRENHQSTIEELETANEELKSANEELQSTNEELQSANEELETSKEELQSLNEELQTVNVELQSKVEDLSRANDDMTNLLNATDIATVFLDNELNIKRHTEQAKRIIRLIPSDVGRPIADLVPRLRYGTLVEDAREVLRTLVYKETEAQGEGNTWYQLRIMPYRTTENMIDGLVITFVDITRTKLLQQSERRLVDSLERSPVSVFGQDRDSRFTWAFTAVFGKRADELHGKTDLELFGASNAERLAEPKQRALSSGKSVRTRLALQLNGSERLYDFYVEPHLNGKGEVEAFSCVASELTNSLPHD